jgi:uncharacterized membrane protein YeiH
MDLVVMNVAKCHQIFEGVLSPFGMIRKVMKFQEFPGVVSAQIFAPPAACSAAKRVSFQHFNTNFVWNFSVVFLGLPIFFQ